MVEEQFHRDDEDRPLREGRTPDEYLRPDDIEYKPCPYAGSRKDHALPMNVSALRQMSAHWDDILGAMVMLRDGYRRIRGILELDLMDAWRVSQLGSALPWWFILGKRETAPAYAAALAKAMQGVGLWAQADFVKMQTETWRPPAITATSILSRTEENGTLIAETEVCAGPEKMLLRFFEAMVGFTPADAVPTPKLVTLIAERDAMLEFAAHYLGFKVALWIHYLARRFVHADIVAALGRQVDERAAQDAIARAHGGATQVARDATVKEIVEGVRALIAGPCEPPDFFPIGPPDLAGTPPATRHAWLRSLASHIVPCSPGLRDVDLRATANEIAAALESPGGESAAVSLDDLAVEVDRVTGCGAAASAAVANALAISARLDALLGELVTRVETGFRRAAASRGVAAAVDTEADAEGGADARGGAARAIVVDAASRDRLLASPPRALLQRLAPHGFAALCRP